MTYILRYKRVELVWSCKSIPFRVEAADWHVVERAHSEDGIETPAIANVLQVIGIDGDVVGPGAHYEQWGRPSTAAVDVNWRV